MAITIGYLAYNAKDLEPLGFIDSIIRTASPEDYPRGSPAFWWPDGTFITSWGQEFPAAKFSYISDQFDIPPQGGDKIYVVLFTFIYYDIEGVEVKKATRVVKMIVGHIPRDSDGNEIPEESLPQDTTNTYHLYPHSETRNRIEFEVTGTLHLNPGSPLIERIVGLQYDDNPVFGRNSIRLLPSDRLGVQLFWSNNVPQPSPATVGGQALWTLGGGLVDLAMSHQDVDWSFQIVNATTIVDRKIIITQKMLDAPRVGGHLIVQIVDDDEGIMKVLCATDSPLDLDASELEVLGTNTPTNKIEEAGNRLGSGHYGDGILWNERLKKIYRSDFVRTPRRVPNQSTMWASKEDLMANTIEINAIADLDETSGDEIEVGHAIYVTYNHVYNFFLRQHVTVSQGFSSLFIGPYAMSFDLTSQWTSVYSFLPSTFWVSKDQSDIGMLVDTEDEESDDDQEPTGLVAIIPGVNPYLQEATNSNWEKYIQDQESIKIAAAEGIPESEVETSLIEWTGQRQINSMLRGGIGAWDSGKSYSTFPNGIIVISHTYDGGIPGGVIWISPDFNPRVIISRDDILDLEWYNEWFKEKVLGVRITGTDISISDGQFVQWDRSVWDLMFDQNKFVNSFVADNDKVLYDPFTAEAIMECSEFDPNDDTETTGIGFSNFDFYKPGTLDPRVDGLQDNLDSEYYSDASTSTFIVPPRQSHNPSVWDPIVIDTIPGNFGGPASVTQQATYLYFQPLAMGLNGRIYFERHPQILINQPFLVRVITRLTSANVSGANVNYNRTKGFYCAPDPDGVHTRMYITDSSVLDKIYSLKVVSDGFSHDELMESSSYPHLYSFRGLSGVLPVYSQGMRILPSPPPESKMTHTDKFAKIDKGYEMSLPGNTESISLTFNVDVKKLSNESYITINIIGDSSGAEFIDLISIPSSGVVDVYLGYASGTIIITSTPEEDIDLIEGIDADIYFIDENAMELISKDCSSCSPLIDSYGSYCVYELLSEGSKSNMLILKSGKVDGPYVAFPYIFPTINTEIISNLMVRSDFKSTFAYLFFTIDGSLLVKRINHSDLDVSQILRANPEFLIDGISELAFSYIKYYETEYPVLSYQYLFDEIFNKCMQLVNIYMEPSYFIHGNVVDNDWIKNEILSSVSFDAYLNQPENNSDITGLSGGARGGRGPETPDSVFDFSKLSDDDTYSSRVVVSSGIADASLSANDGYLTRLGYSSEINEFTAEILSNGSMVVFYVVEGRVYGKISSNFNSWIPLFGSDYYDGVRGYKPVRVWKLNPSEVGLPEETDMFYVQEGDIDDSLLDADLSSESFDVSSISSCYDQTSDSLYLFYVLDGFTAFHKLSGRSLLEFIGEDMYYKLDTTTPRALMRGREELGDFPNYLVGVLPDGLSDAINFEGKNYLQFKYSIESIESLQSEGMSIQESSISAFILDKGYVRFMYSDSNGSLRGGIISGLTSQLDVQLRE